MEVEQVKEDIEAVIFSESQIKSKVKELAQKISQDYQGKKPVLVGILKGAIVFMADLSRELTIPVKMDFMAVSSYGSATKTSGVVRILKDLDENIKGKDVLIVEDIIDSGLTLSYLIKNLKSRGPKSLEICVLLSKKGKQRAPLRLKYEGFKMPDRFVVGYGLDFADEYRNLPCVCALSSQVYTQKRGGQIV